MLERAKTTNSPNFILPKIYMLHSLNFPTAKVSLYMVYSILHNAHHSSSCLLLPYKEDFRVECYYCTMYLYAMYLCNYIYLHKYLDATHLD